VLLVVDPEDAWHGWARAGRAFVGAFSLPQVLFISSYPSPRTTATLPGPLLAKLFSEADLLVRVRSFLGGR